MERSGITVGLRDLDDDTHGLMPATFWLIIGTPSVGRTVLAGQIAMQAALGRTGSVALLSGRESAETIMLNLVSALSRVAAHAILKGRVDDDQRSRLDVARSRLAAAPLWMLHPSDPTWRTDKALHRADLEKVIGGEPLADVLVIDDVDTLLGRPLVDALRDLRDWTRKANFSLVVTAPEESLLAQDVARPEVRRETDVLLRIRRPDLDDPHHARAGEADLEILRHRGGPTETISVAFQGHYRRFIDFDR
jgi:replicative DNA helicase